MTIFCNFNFRYNTQKQSWLTKILCFNSITTVSKRVLNKDLFGILGPYLYFRVLIFTILASFTQRMSIFAGIGSGLHCWQILIFTYAYALIFIHRRFGSLFWLLGVLIGSLFIFQGPYFHCFDFIHAKNVNSVCMYATMSEPDLCSLKP